MLRYQALFVILLSLFSALTLTNGITNRQNGLVLAADAQRLGEAPTEAPQLYLPFMAASSAQVTAPNHKLLYTNAEYGFAFEYPAAYEQSPMQEWGCGLTTQAADGGGFYFSGEDDEQIVTFGNNVNLIIAPAHGVGLAAYVDQFIQRVKERTLYLPTRDDNRLDRTPRGYVIEATYHQIPNLFALFAQQDKVYIFFARLSLACRDEAQKISVENSFWHAVESFRFHARSENKGRIAGVVTDEQGIPLPGIEVHLYKFESDGNIFTDPWEELYNQVVTTDAAGAYHHLFLEPGQYTLRFMDTNDRYAFEFYGDAPTLTNARSIDVVANQTADGVDASLTLGGVITGTIQMFDGTPISQVEPYRYSDGNFQPAHSRGTLALYYHDGQQWSRLRRIDLSGDPRLDLAANRYTFGGLRQGAYRLWYYTKYSKGLDPDIRSHCINVAHIYAEYYPGVPKVEDATDIAITPNQMTQNINLVIGGNPKYGRIEGKVTDKDGAPLAGMVLLLHVLGNSFENRFIECAGVTDQTGHYTTPALPPWSYRISFFDPAARYAPGYYGNVAQVEATPLLNLAEGATLSGIDVVLNVGRRLVGQLRMSDGSWVNGNVEISLLRDYKDFELFRVYPGHYDPTAGIYSITGLPADTYTLEYKLQHNGIDYAVDWPSPIHVAVTDADVTNFDLMIPNSSAQSGLIRGRVTNAAGEPLEGIHVNLGGLGFEWAYATTDSQGDYQITAGSGENIEYLVAFADPQGQYAFEYYDDALTATTATALPMITNTIYSNINAVLAPGGVITGHITLIDGVPLSQVQAREVDLMTGKAYKGYILLSYNSGGEWGTLQMIKVTDQSTDQFDLTTNTYRFAGLAPGRYRILVETTHNGVEYDNYLAPGSGVSVAAGATTQADVLLGQDDNRLLALYALAFDNDSNSADNLAPQLPPVMQSIIDATAQQPTKLAVVLADGPGDGDSRIYLVQAGRARPMPGLSNAAFQLDPTLLEADMADGATLGRFIRWARNSYPSQRTLFGYVGHGAPLAPETSLDWIKPRPNARQAVGGLFPLPVRVDTYPSFTDHHPEGLISPYDLAEALRIGTNNGADPIQIADITHCFAASIEELYELSSGAHPYAEIIVASPNYAYLPPTLLGKTLGAIQTTMTLEPMAKTIVATYDRLLTEADAQDGNNTVEHPSLLVAVNSSQVARIKANWDKVAYALLQDWDAQKLRNAYIVSPKYDTTLCPPQDWQLAAPDALVDLQRFAQALVAEYGASSPVGMAATEVVNNVATAILQRYARNGRPWYAGPNAPLWDFDQHRGIALYVDLQGKPATDGSNRVAVSWQAHWYTASNETGDNPHPHAFVQNGYNGVTWATVFNEFWRRQNVSLTTAVCFPQPELNKQWGEVSVAAIVYPISGTLLLHTPTPLAAAIRTQEALVQPQVRFQVYNATQTMIFSETINAGYLAAGLHQVAATQPFTPSAPGEISVVITVDAANLIVESNEEDNQLTQVYTVAASNGGRPTVTATLAAASLMVNTPTAALNLTALPTSTLVTLTADLYQFLLGSAPGTRHAYPVQRQTLDRNSPQLDLTMLTPGAVIAHIWASTPGGLYSTTPAILEFNYAPVHAALNAQNSHYYLLPASATQGWALHLTVLDGESSLFAWSPANFWGPDWWAVAAGDDAFALPAADLGGDYLIEVYGEWAGSYSLTVTSQPAGTTGLVSAAATGGDIAYIPNTKISLIRPYVLPPNAVALFIPQAYLPVMRR